MKRLFLISILALGLAGVLQASNKEPRIQIYDLSEKQLGVFVKYDSISASNLQIRIIDEDGHILYKASETLQIYQKRFNLSELDRGRYQIEFEDKNRIYRYSFKVSNDDIHFRISEKDVVFKPVITKDEEKLSLKFFSGKQPVTVTLQDEDGNDIYNTRFENQEQVDMTFNIRNLNPGAYRLRVSFNSLRFDETLTIQK